jgi:hypothetical protein
MKDGAKNTVEQTNLLTDIKTIGTLPIYLILPKSAIVAFYHL